MEPPNIFLKAEFIGNISSSILSDRFPSEVWVSWETPLGMQKSLLTMGDDQVRKQELPLFFFLLFGSTSALSPARRAAQVRQHCIFSPIEILLLIFSPWPLWTLTKNLHAANYLMWDRLRDSAHYSTFLLPAPPHRRHIQPPDHKGAHCRPLTDQRGLIDASHS